MGRDPEILGMSWASKGKLHPEARMNSARSIRTPMAAYMERCPGISWTRWAGKSFKSSLEELSTLAASKWDLQLVCGYVFLVLAVSAFFLKLYMKYKYIMNKNKQKHLIWIMALAIKIVSLFQCELSKALEVQGTGEREYVVICVFTNGWLALRSARQ